MFHGAKSWISDFNHPHYQAAINSMKRVFKVDPDLTREGGSIPVTLTFQELTGKNVLLLPIGIFFITIRPKFYKKKILRCF